MYHGIHNPYNIDYCFASKNFEAVTVVVGNFGEWAKKSDHMLIIVTLTPN